MTTTESPTAAAPAASGPSRWRRLVPRTRRSRGIAAAVAAVLIGLLGFGAGYAVGDDGPDGPPGFSRDGGFRDGGPDGPRWGDRGPGADAPGSAGEAASS